MDIDKIEKMLTEKVSPEKIYIDEPMKLHTTFKVGGKADIFVNGKTILDIMHTVMVSKANNIPLTIIGNGSNILVKDNGIRGIVLKICTDNYEIIDGDDEVSVVADAGLQNGKLAQILLKNEITGFEFASGIPGTIGGAVKINAGAYGGEFKDIVEETVYLDLEDYKIKVLDNEKHEFSYRHSIFEEKDAIIINCKLKLKKGKKEEIQKSMNENINSRKEKQPIEYPSAGSTFKRGEDFITSKIIDECGLKGTHVGDAEVSTKHAGFIINKGNATASDIIELIEQVKNKVLEEKGKELKLEIKIIGE